MTQPSILILAASRYQIPVIQKARDMGLRVITLDNRPDNPGHKLADVSCIIDTTDMEKVMDVAMREKVSGVVAACTDVAVPTAAYVTAKLGLPSMPLDGCRILCNKEAFRTYQKDKGYPQPVWTGSEDQIRRDLEFVTKSWVLKPLCSSGSKGIRIVSTAEEFQKGMVEAQAGDPKGRVICEEFIEGKQGTCEGMFLDGKIERCWITERMTASKPYVATAGHRIPSVLKKEEVYSLRLQIQGILQDLGFTNTLFDADFVCGEKVVLLEMSPRLGGNSLAKLLLVSAKVDLPQCALEIALGRKVSNLGKEHSGCAQVIIWGVEKDGRLSYERDFGAELAGINWISEFSLDKDIGEPVSLFTDGGKRLGEAIFTAASREELLEREEWMRSHLDLKAVSPDNLSDCK